MIYPYHYHSHTSMPALCYKFISISHTSTTNVTTWINHTSVLAWSI